MLTGIIDEQVQSGLRLQESLSEVANRCEACQVKLHINHISASSFLKIKSNS